MGTLIVSIVSIVIATLSVVVSFYLGVRNSKASERSATAAEASRQIAERQLENAVRAHEASLQPYVWADLRPRDDGQMLVFVVGNSGPTVAKDVLVTCEPRLEEIVPEGKRDRAKQISSHLDDGLRSIAPGRVFMWNLGVAHEFFPDEGRSPVPEMRITITATGVAGPLEPAEYLIALEDLKQQASRAVGVALLEQPLKRIADALKEHPRDI